MAITYLVATCGFVKGVALGAAVALAASQLAKRRSEALS
jgi:hypothetical protein